MVVFGADLGKGTGNHAATGSGSNSALSWATGSHTFTLQSAVPSGGKIFVGLLLYLTSATITSFAGTTVSLEGLTWRVAKSTVVAGSLTSLIVEADAPSGAASGHTVQMNHANSGGGSGWGMSFTGCATGAVNASNAAVASTSYTVGSLTTTGDGMTLSYVAGFFNDTAGTWHTPGAGDTEVHDFGEINGPQANGTQYQIRTGASTYSMAGTISNTGGGTAQVIGLAVNAAASATKAPPAGRRFPQALLIR